MSDSRRSSRASATEFPAIARFRTIPYRVHWWGTVLFFLHLIPMIGVTVIVMPEVIEALEYGEGFSTIAVMGRLGHFLSIAIALCTAMITSLIYAVLIQAVPQAMFWFTVGLYMILAAGAIVIFALVRWIVPLVLACLAVILGFTLILMSMSRLKFDMVLLNAITNVMRKYAGMRGIVLVSLVVTSMWCLWVILMVAGCVMNQFYVMFPYIILSFLWTLFVIKNCLFVTATRVFCIYYTLMGTQLYPTEHKVTSSSWVWAITSGFGAVCYGSLFIPVFHLVFGYNSGGKVDQEGKRVDGCWGFRTKALSKFNWYAWSHVVMYNKSVNRSSRDAWLLISEKGVDVIVKPSLLNPYIKLIWGVAGFISGLAALLFMHLVGLNGVMLAVGIAFVLGAIHASVTTVLLDAGIASTAVIMAEEIKSLQRVEADLFEMVWELWPEVVSSA